MTTAAAAAAVIVTATDILNDAEYATIREEFRTTMQTLSQKLSNVITPQFFQNWGLIYANFQAYQFLIGPLRARVLVWNPDHEDTQTVKKLFLDFFALFDHPEVDSHEAAIAKVTMLVFYMAHHGTMQEERDSEMRLKKQRDQELAFETDCKSQAQSTSSDNLSSMLEAQRRLEQQSAEARAKMEVEDEALFSTPILDTEVGLLYQLQALIEAIWPPGATTYETALFAFEHAQFTDLQQALEFPYTHLLPLAIQRACKEIITALKTGGAHPEAPLLMAYNQNMRHVRRLISETTFTRLFN